ncbi:MAG: ABC transporter permease [Acidimicrobiia bacterium]|nr:ABC transporter permease [Acidimicrobiia bacterium]
MPPGQALLSAERDGPLVVEGDLVAIAALEAGTKHKQKLSWGARLALGWIILVVGMAILAPILPIGDPNKTVKLDPPCPTSVRLGIEQENCYITARGPFSEEGTAPGYLLGGDGNSRSMLARLVYGSRASLEIAIGAVLLGLLIGGSLGLIAGYFGGKIDTGLTGIFNVLLSIPAIVLALSLVAFLTPKSDANTSGGSGLPVEVILIIAIGVVSIPLLGRITRASALTWSQREFVLAARAQGAKNGRIMIREVLPNVLPAMFSIALLGIAIAIVAEAGLSILGVGVRPPTPSWGNMIAYDRGYLNTGAPHTVFEPAIMIFLTVLSLNYLGDVVRARFDVRESAI